MIQVTHSLLENDVIFLILRLLFIHKMPNKKLSVNQITDALSFVWEKAARDKNRHRLSVLGKFSVCVLFFFLLREVELRTLHLTISQNLLFKILSHVKPVARIARKQSKYKRKNLYSRTSMARTLMARLPRLFRTRS